jgi:hypothetical protein
MAMASYGVNLIIHRIPDFLEIGYVPGFQIFGVLGSW